MSKAEGDREARIAAIAARARMESAPRVDVTAAVLRRLRVSATGDASDRPMLWLAAGAVAAAAVVAIISMPYLSGTLDPLTEFLAEADTSVICQFMSDTPLPLSVTPSPLPAPRRSWMKTAALSMVVLMSGMIIGSGLTVIGIRRWAEEMRQRPDMFSNRILTRMEKDLKLTKEQKSEMGKIFKDAREELDEVRGQHRAQAHADFRDFHDEVAQVLTPDQQKEWETWWKRARERAFKERPGGPPRPGGPGGPERDRGSREYRPLPPPGDRPPRPVDGADEVQGPPPQGIPERHFAPDPSAPSDENQPEPKRIPPPL